MSEPNPQPSSRFFRLPFDIRCEIYSYLDFPPHDLIITKEASGFILSCKLAYGDAVAEAAARMTKALNQVQSRLADYNAPHLATDRGIKMIVPAVKNATRFSELQTIILTIPYLTSFPASLASFEGLPNALHPLLNKHLSKLLILFTAGPGTDDGVCTMFDNINPPPTSKGHIFRTMLKNIYLLILHSDASDPGRGFPAIGAIPPSNEPPRQRPQEHPPSAPSMGLSPPQSRPLHHTCTPHRQNHIPSHDIPSHDGRRRKGGLRWLCALPSSTQLRCAGRRAWHFAHGWLDKEQPSFPSDIKKLYPEVRSRY